MCLVGLLVSGLYIEEGGCAPIGARKKWRFMPSAESENDNAQIMFNKNNDYI